MSEATIAEKLKQLYELQQIDCQIDEITVLKGELPMEVTDLEDAIAGLDTRISKINSNIEEFNKEIKGHKAKITESEALILKYKNQLDNVKNNREFEALTKELQMQELEIQLSEKKIKKASEEIERIQKNLSSNMEIKEKNAANLALKKDELKEIIAKTEKDEEKLQKASEKARKKVEDRLLKAYDKTRSSYRNGLAVVTVERNSCGGCFNKIPPQLQLEIAMRKNIIVCEHCGRILVDSDILNQDN
jgi:uncharacterized protein